MSNAFKFISGILLVFPLLLNTSCNDKKLPIGNMQFCKEEKYRAGEVNAESNLRSFNGYALYSFNEDSSGVKLTLGQIWDSYCGWNERLSFLKINISELNDTIYLNHVSENGITSEHPTANYDVYDHDSPLHIYTLLIADSVSDWVYIESYDPESKLIAGSFQVSLQSTNIRDTNNVYPPYQVYFNNGSFEAHPWPTY